MRKIITGNILLKTVNIGSNSCSFFSGVLIVCLFFYFTIFLLYIKGKKEIIAIAQSFSLFLFVFVDSIKDVYE